MAAIPVVLNGTFTSDAGSSVGTFIGTMAYSDRAPGGGPIVPPSGPVDPGYGYPEKPVDPGYGVPEKPPHIWGGPIDPYPGHPLPEPPIDPPTEPPSNPASPNWVWGWSPKIPPNGGWTPVYVPGPTDPQPH